MKLSLLSLLVLLNGCLGQTCSGSNYFQAGIADGVYLGMKAYLDANAAAITEGQAWHDGDVLWQFHPLDAYVYPRDGVGPEWDRIDIIGANWSPRAGVVLTLFAHGGQSVHHVGTPIATIEDDVHGWLSRTTDLSEDDIGKYTVDEGRLRPKDNGVSAERPQYQAPTGAWVEATDSILYEFDVDARIDLWGHVVPAVTPRDLEAGSASWDGWDVAFRGDSIAWQGTIAGGHASLSADITGRGHAWVQGGHSEATIDAALDDLAAKYGGRWTSTGGQWIPERCHRSPDVGN